MTASDPLHLVWDWNGTLLDDLAIVVAATNTSLRELGGPTVTEPSHRRRFRRPVSAYYEELLGRPVEPAEFERLDRVFHEAYDVALVNCPLAIDARDALVSWSGTQSLLSMWFHDRLVATVARYELGDHFVRVDGLRGPLGGGRKYPHLAAHLAAIRIPATECVLIGDSVDDAEAAVAVGARVVLYSGGFTDPRRLRRTGHPVMDNLTDAVATAATFA